MTKRSAPPGTQVVQRVVRVLKAFTPEHPEWQPGELATALGLSKTTAHRLLAALESEDLVTRHPTTGGHRLGPAAIALGTQALRSNDLRTLGHGVLVELAQETGETATLEVLADDQVLILDEVAGRHLIAANAELGMRWPLHATSTGKALLASLPEERRRKLLPRRLARYTAATITGRDALGRELERVRERGYATAVEELEAGYVAAGAVFHGALGDVAGALSVGGPASRLDAARLADVGERLRAAAQQLSRLLGYA